MSPTCWCPLKEKCFRKKGAFDAVKITLAASSFLGISSSLSQCWAHLSSAGVRQKGAGRTEKGKSSIFIRTRPAKNRQLQCLLAPYDVLTVYLRNIRTWFRHESLNLSVWAASLEVPAGTDPHGYSWCPSCGSCHSRRCASQTLSRDRDWLYGPEAESSYLPEVSSYLVALNSFCWPGRNEQY